MTKHLIALLALAGLAALPACSNSDFYGEAGQSIDEGGFGNPTMNNVQLQTGQKSYTESLARRFAEEVPSTVNFAFDSAVLDQSAKLTLRKQADWIRQFPEVRFRVYGHTDAVGSAGYNKSLGKRRADAVVRYLSSLGISTSRLEAVVSFGETQPLIVSEGRERRNRRTVTEVSGFVDSHPAVLNGKYAEVIWREYVQSATEVSTVTEATE
ncbi:Outer membrane lipoprotein Omp16 precursor [Pseudoruegeria aquimaris]|uniref:Outer membrane lipoprotein Omp16 n=1 Tax=Pseudoruegeria aquimaris TaxID=393663 RepID=A0A1Y5SC77_9RHOB|nr:OmpA family protein [Pseudoruegeria aquimaris]SLN37432.1 Outer membrane lipoprotein Omp16 precursor [Pseudoruegeria aquimaris]